MRGPPRPTPGRSPPAGLAAPAHAVAVVALAALAVGVVWAGPVAAPLGASLRAVAPASPSVASRVAAFAVPAPPRGVALLQGLPIPAIEAPNRPLLEADGAGRPTRGFVATTNTQPNAITVEVPASVLGLASVGAVLWAVAGIALAQLRRRFSAAEASLRPLLLAGPPPLPRLLPTASALSANIAPLPGYQPWVACAATAAVDPEAHPDSLEAGLVRAFQAAIDAAFPGVGVAAAIAPGRDVANGEYQCNNAMQLARLAKGSPGAPATPQEVGQRITNHLPTTDFIESTNVAPQGFINIRIRKQYVSKHLLDVMKGGLRPPRQPRQRVLVDFSSPNIAKEMHVGHLRSTIIGECISRTFEFCGHDVLRINHVGDWGTQFGMLIAHLKDSYPDFQTSPPPISDLVAFYKESKKRFDADPAFKERAQREVVELQGGNADNLQAWRLICEVSRVEFQRIYERLEVTLHERGESFYNPFMPSMVQELRERQKAMVSEGATVIVTGEHRPLTDLTQVEVERLVQAVFLKQPLVTQEALVAYLTQNGLVAADVAGQPCLNVGTAKSPQLLPLAAVDATAGVETAAKVARAVSQAAAAQKPKQGVDSGFLDLLRGTPGLVTVVDGVESAFVPTFSYPFMIQKRDGGFTYDTTDLAALRYRFQEEKVDRIIYVTDVGQEPHFLMLFAAAKDVGYFDPAAQRCDHVGFGLVFGPDGKKLKTREGETIRLADLLDEAPRRAYEESLKREAEKAAAAQERGEAFEGLTEEELRHNAQVIGYGAVKYFDLRQNRTSSYRFSYDEMLSLKGNTAVHLIYAYVRMRSIARKAGIAAAANVWAELEAAHPEGVAIELNSDAEWALGLHLVRFPSTVQQLTEELAPNKMTDFLYQLVGKFNDFYTKDNILKAKDRASKLLLCEVTAQTLREGLRLLGIGVLEKL